MRQLFPCGEMASSFSAFSLVLCCYCDYSLLALQVALVKVCLQNLVQLKEAAGEHGSGLGFF